MDKDLKVVKTGGNYTSRIIETSNQYPINISSKSSEITKILIQRDYNTGTLVCFNTDFPKQLEGILALLLILYTNADVPITIKVHNLDIEVLRFIDVRLTDKSYQLFRNFGAKLNVFKHNYRQKIISKLNEISKEIYNAKKNTQLVRSENIDENEKNTIKNQFKEINEKICKYKERNEIQFQKLTIDQERLEAGINLIKKIVDDDNFVKILKSSEPEAHKVANTSTNNYNQKHGQHLPSKILEFEDFHIRYGGSTGGWDIQDHNIFVKMMTKTDKLTNYIPTHTQEQIDSHKRWFKKYSHLKTEKKKAIENWKKYKQDKIKNKKHAEKNNETKKPVKTDNEKKNSQNERYKIKKMIHDWKKKKQNENEKMNKLMKEKSQNLLLMERKKLKKKKPAGYFSAIPGTRPNILPVPDKEKEDLNLQNHKNQTESIIKGQYANKIIKLKNLQFERDVPSNPERINQFTKSYMLKLEKSEETKDSAFLNYIPKRFPDNLSNDVKRELSECANALVSKGKGLLAADESTGTIGKRFAGIKLENTEENRRAYRQLLFKSGKKLANHVSGVILYEETLFQKSDDGQDFTKMLKDNGIIPGIKVDKGVVQLMGTNGETTTQGLDGLAERCKKYYDQGARFAKWRSVLMIKDYEPSQLSMIENANVLARYASICQQNRLVPIVEPEILPDEGTLLKPNMVTSGHGSKEEKVPGDIARATVTALQRTVPTAVPGIVFLSGGQSEVVATVNLDAINKFDGKKPWSLTFSYGRALQGTTIKTWQGKTENVAKAQKQLLLRAAANGAAATGQYKGEDKESLADNESLYVAKHVY
ncbi:hypothetical protein A3Q56_01601 [Intoshia linei]|uniref:fructose-bisphosphate aldolase n=1 Tax=Intoshia linei TaxID=1819745 RepID=A0A177B8N6_9BILA|nr:hypothetical protein A3Q56_01601 [Intoshia linei]